MPRSQIKAFTQALLTETRKSVPSAGINAAASGLRFSQLIKEGSIVVKGAGGAGADIEAVAIVNGLEKRLVRELVAFQGDLSKHSGKAVLDALDTKANRQAVAADIREIQLELTGNAYRLRRTGEKSSSRNWRVLRQAIRM